MAALPAMPERGAACHRATLSRRELGRRSVARYADIHGVGHQFFQRLRGGTVALMEGKQTHPRLALRSDSEGEFGEGSREPMPWIGIKAEFVAAAAKILDEGVPGCRSLVLTGAV